MHSITPSRGSCQTAPAGQAPYTNTHELQIPAREVNSPFVWPKLGISSKSAVSDEGPEKPQPTVGFPTPYSPNRAPTTHTTSVVSFVS